jgi:hypothetical protein
MARKVTNDDHLESVIRKVYGDALQLDWQHQTDPQHTAQYARWLDDREVGGVLGQWMSLEEQRVWLKDGPLKEFARARAGMGDCARYLDKHPSNPSVVVPRTLGQGWSPVPKSNGVKPLSCRASDGVTSITLFWGPARDFKHLLWAALGMLDRSPNMPVRIAVFDTISAPLAAGKKETFVRIASRCGIEVSFIRL